MSRHNHMLLISIQCNMSLLSHCIFSWSSDSCQPNLSFKVFFLGFHRCIKGEYNCVHPRICPLLLLPQLLHLILIFPSLRPSLPSVERPSVRLLFSFAIGRVSSPRLSENNKLFNIIAVNLNASLFDRQLNCHSDKSPINANNRVPSLLWLQ